MSQKSVIFICLAIGSSLGGLIPSLWGAGFMSLWSVLFTAIGGIIGVWIGFNLSK